MECSERADKYSARQRMKQFLRRIEREWWSKSVEECEEASNFCKIGSMYKILKVTGRKEWKALPSVGITEEEFREHFEKVSEKRSEVDPAAFREVIEQVQAMRGCEPISQCLKIIYYIVFHRSR